jgi:PAS domain S-box-containing protein
MSEEIYAADDPRLVESEQRYRAVIEYASDMIQSVRPDGTFEFVNQAWIKTLGYTPDDLKHMSIWDIIHPDSLAHCQELFMLAVGGAPINYMQAIFLGKDGSAIPVEGNVTSRFMGDTVIATHGFFRDISERLRAEELAERNAKLEREQQARYLEKMAALGKLSAGLAHELNNPAAAAQRAGSRLIDSLTKRDRTMRELVKEGFQLEHWLAVDALLQEMAERSSDKTELDPLAINDQETAVEEWLENHDIDRAWDLAPSLVQAGITVQQIEELAPHLPSQSLTCAIEWITETLSIKEVGDIVTRSSHRISELVSAVKGYSYMDRGAEQLVDIHEGIESTLLILGHRLRDITITRQYARGLPKIQVFGNTLNQVWTNILDNAIDAMNGKGTIAIRSYSEDDKLVVEIEDSGSGIAPEDLACIFEPFYTTKPQGQGTGLGLDTAWRIVTEEHGGMIDVTSQPGSTIFKITVPVVSTRTASAA